jgi:Leucine-rich repeat (LRR) protein
MKRTALQLEQELNNRMDRAEYVLRLRAVDDTKWDEKDILLRSLYWMSTKDKLKPTLQRLAITAFYCYASASDSSWRTCCPDCKICETGKRLLSAKVHECEWYGITCDENRQVTRMEWTDNGLSSADPDWPLELSFLSNLELLWISDNPNLTSRIPNWISKLSSLKSLSVFRTGLSGEIPAQLYQLSSLTALRIYATKLSGTISPQIAELSNLSWLWLHQNRLSLGIPRELAALEKLEGLTLYGNDFTNNVDPPEEICQLKEKHSLNTYVVDCQEVASGAKCLCCTLCFPTPHS